MKNLYSQDFEYIVVRGEARYYFEASINYISNKNWK